MTDKKHLLWLAILVQLSVAFCATAKDYNLLLADHTQKHLFIRSAAGEIVWKHPGKALFEAWMQRDGSIIYSTRATVERIYPDLKSGTGGKVAWRYQFGTGLNAKEVPKGMIIGCSPLKNGNFMITETGTYRLVEISPEGKVVNSITLPPPKASLQYSLRLTRQTASGTYLVSRFGEGKFIEFDQSGKQVREIPVGRYCSDSENSAYEALPLKDGRLLVSCGPQNQIMILDANGKPEWKLEAKELEGRINLFWITKLVPLENGNIIVCNYCKGNAKTIAFEITRDKKIVWALSDSRIKGLTTLQLLNDDYRPLTRGWAQ